MTTRRIHRTLATEKQKDLIQDLLSYASMYLDDALTMSGIAQKVANPDMFTGSITVERLSLDTMLAATASELITWLVAREKAIAASGPMRPSEEFE